jgi:dihydrofolate reductase
LTQLVYYAAASLDGVIATPEGGVDWLTLFKAEDSGYAEFYASVDALLMGRRTYEQVLSFGNWPYAGKPTWVFSRRQLTVEVPEVTATDRDPREVVGELAARHFQRIWLVGGAQLAASCRASGLVSEYVVSILPVLLGGGIPLFLPASPAEWLKFVDANVFPSGLVQLRYLRGIGA